MELPEKQGLKQIAREQTKIDAFFNIFATHHAVAVELPEKQGLKQIAREQTKIEVLT